MTKPNMSLRSFERWQETEAYQEYKAQYSGDLGPVVRRTKRYLRGSASDSDRRKVESFISRMKEQDAGKRKFGSGPSAVSARTCSLRNWGFDTTGRFS